MNTNLEILTKAKDLITDKSHWIQREYVSKVDGVPTAWCAVGALRNITGNYLDHSIGSPLYILENASVELYNMNVVGVNDELGHEETLQVYDLAIKNSGG